jgi:K319L-like, PKD domain
MMTMLSLSILAFGLNNNNNNNVSISILAFGANDDKNRINNINHNGVNNDNLSSINDIFSQIAGSNTDIDNQHVQQVLQQIHTQIAIAAGEDEATNAINQIGSIIHLNPNGGLAQSLSFLAKQQAAGKSDTVKQAAMKVADRISSGDDDLGKSFAQDVEQSSSGTRSERSSSIDPTSSLPSSSSSTPPLSSSPKLRSEADESITEGIGEEPDTDEKEANVLSRGSEEARTLANNIVIPDDTPFKSNECDGSLDKFVPNPFIKSIGSPRFLVQDCVTVVGEVTWTHYINTDGDANFNIKLDSKYNSLLTPANNSPEFKGALHVEVVCQGPNKSKDPIKVDQCKNPKYDGPKFRLPKVGTRVQVTGTYLLDVNEGGHAEIHPAYNVVFNPTSSSPPPTPAPTPTPADNSLIADAGHSRPDQTVNQGAKVAMDSSQSRNPNGGPLTFAWTQIGGPPVLLSTPNEAKTSFNAPSNLQADTTMIFKLTVTNSTGLSDSDTVSILVRHGEMTKGTPYQAGYDHGCGDAKLPPSKRYINQPGKGPDSHSEEFMSGYNAGFSACSTN